MSQRKARQRVSTTLDEEAQFQVVKNLEQHILREFGRINFEIPECIDMLLLYAARLLLIGTKATPEEFREMWSGATAQAFADAHEEKGAT